MAETQQTISDWAEETFGPAGSTARVAARANEEMAELLRVLTADPDSEAGRRKAAEEAADVAIVLCRLAVRVGCELSLDSFATPTVPARATGASPLWWASSANIWLADVIDLLSDDDPEATPDLLYGCVSLLGKLCQVLGTTLQAEIDRKMTVNRGRTWQKDGTGHGYHVRQK